jgi:RNA polymerase sigma factor (sigma-70 family)
VRRSDKTIARYFLSDMWDYSVFNSRQCNQQDLTDTLSAAGQRGAWRRWKREGAILALQPNVERIARNVKWMFAPHIDLRDLTQAGNVGLCKAADAFRPALAPLAELEPFAFFRIKGAIIDSQKRRTYREESYVSLQGIQAANNGWLPAALDTDPGPDALALAERNQIHQILQDAIADLPVSERAALRGQLAGQPLAVTARQLGRSLSWTRAKLAEARILVGMAMRGE